MVAFLYANIAKVYNQLRNIDLALLLYLKAYNIKKINLDVYPFINELIFTGIGQIYLTKGKFEDALVYL